jgi:hypothetical protein
MQVPQCTWCIPAGAHRLLALAQFYDITTSLPTAPQQRDDDRNQAGLIAALNQMTL